MTRILLLLTATLFMLASCKSKEEKQAEELIKKMEEFGKNLSGEKSDADTKSGSMDNTLEELKKMPALTTEQLKALLPQELLGMKRTSFSANSMMGYGVAEASYKSDDNKKLTLTIYDVAGEAGSAWYSMMFWGFNMEREDDNGYEKTTTFNGAKAIEKYQKNNEEYSLLFFTGKRLLVNVEGQNTGLDAVKQAASSLNLTVN